MAMGVGRSRICLASFNSPTLKTPCYTQTSRRYLLYRPSYGRFCPNFVAMATGVGLSRIFLLSFNSPTPKTPCYTQRPRGYLLYRPSYGRFCPNFVAVATGVGRSRICLASFNSATTKTPCYTQKSRGYLLYRPSYCRFCPKFRCHGNGGLVAVEFVWRHLIARAGKPPVIRKDLGDISHIGRVITDFVPNFVAMASGVIRGRG